jgi:hypothetical protein
LSERLIRRLTRLEAILTAAGDNRGEETRAAIRAIIQDPEALDAAELLLRAAAGRGANDPEAIQAAEERLRVFIDRRGGDDHDRRR